MRVSRPAFWAAGSTSSLAATALTAGHLKTTARMPHPKVNAPSRFARKNFTFGKHQWFWGVSCPTIESKVMRITAVYLCEAENGLGFGEKHP
jgi:hypothetical protein